MTVSTKAVVLVLLALWGLATAHCALEQMPGLEFLACCQHASNAPHQDNDCDQDGCAAVESGFYKIEDNPAFSPALTLSTALQAWEYIDKPDAVPSFLPVSLAPPEYSRLWQFHYRAALPPRAPSFVV